MQMYAKYYEEENELEPNQIDNRVVRFSPYP